MDGMAARHEAEKILAELPDRISDIIKPFVRESPDHPALVQDDVTWTYAELAAVVADTAIILKLYDIRPGDRVLIVSENCLALAGLILGIAEIAVAERGHLFADAQRLAVEPEHRARVGGLRRLAGGVRSHAHADVEAGVAEVERPRPALVAVADHRHRRAVERRHVGVVLVVDRRHGRDGTTRPSKSPMSETATRSPSPPRASSARFCS